MVMNWGRVFYFERIERRIVCLDINSGKYLRKDWKNRLGLNYIVFWDLFKKLYIILRILEYYFSCEMTLFYLGF